MSAVGGHILAAVCGALLGGLLAYLLLPQLFWACLLGGALTGGAIRVALVLLREDPAE